MDEWLVTVGNTWILTAKWVGGLAVLYGVLVSLMPCNPGMYWCNKVRSIVTDLMYWFVAPLATRFGASSLLLLALALFCGGKQPDLLGVRNVPIWQQCLAMLVIEDVILYVVHRIFHSRWAWKVHAIHHAPTDLDWTATARFHPINHVLEFGLADTAVLLLGFSWDALGTLVICNMVYSSMVHANLNWTFGPLRYVLASPVFHRWHHTTEAAGLNKNFASTFPILDLICGSFYMPAGKLPEEFGTGDPDFPQGFWAQIFYPFKASKPKPASMPERPVVISQKAGKGRQRSRRARVPVSQP
jgi:sterol desaturase/sphingolipid hydroxylase (fatty acid hydroxylase superfamily)